MERVTSARNSEARYNMDEIMSTNGNPRITEDSNCEVIQNNESLFLDMLFQEASPRPNAKATMPDSVSSNEKNNQISDKKRNFVSSEKQNTRHSDNRESCIDSKDKNINNVEDNNIEKNKIEISREENDLPFEVQTKEGILVSQEFMNSNLVVKTNEEAEINMDSSGLINQSDDFKKLNPLEGNTEKGTETNQVVLNKENLAEEVTSKLFSSNSSELNTSEEKAIEAENMPKEGVNGESVNNIVKDSTDSVETSVNNNIAYAAASGSSGGNGASEFGSGNSSSNSGNNQGTENIAAIRQNSNSANAAVNNKELLAKQESMKSSIQDAIDKIEVLAKNRKGGNVQIHLKDSHGENITLKVKAFGSNIDATILSGNSTLQNALQESKEMLSKGLEERGFNLNSFSSDSGMEDADSKSGFSYQNHRDNASALETLRNLNHSYNSYVSGAVHGNNSIIEENTPLNYLA